MILFAEVQAGDFAAESAAEELPQEATVVPLHGDGEYAVVHTEGARLAVAGYSVSRLGHGVTQVLDAAIISMILEIWK